MTTSMINVTRFPGVGLLYGGGCGGGSGRRPSSNSSLLVVRAELGSTINPSIRKDEPKVTDTVVLAELAKPNTAYCRCWRSKTFPLCDGSHVKHNKETGDNVGPLLLKK